MPRVHYMVWFIGVFLQSKAGTQAVESELEKKRNFGRPGCFRLHCYSLV